jgi:hypothetical protein
MLLRLVPALMQAKNFFFCKPTNHKTVKKKVKVKQSRYGPGVAQRVPGI